MSVYVLVGGGWLGSRSWPTLSDPCCLGMVEADMSAAAARESITVPYEAPMRTSPKTTATVESREAPKPTSTHPRMPRVKPPASTGTRPERSIVRPAGRGRVPPCS